MLRNSPRSSAKRGHLTDGPGRGGAAGAFRGHLGVGEGRVERGKGQTEHFEARDEEKSRGKGLGERGMKNNVKFDSSYITFIPVKKEDKTTRNVICLASKPLTQFTTYWVAGRNLKKKSSW